MAGPRLWRASVSIAGAAIVLTGCATNPAGIGFQPVVETVTHTEIVTQPDTTLQPSVDGRLSAEPLLRNLADKHFFATEAVGFNLVTGKVSQVPESDAGRVSITLEDAETGNKLQLEQWFPLDIAILGAWGIPDDYSEDYLARLTEEPFHLLVGESDNCMILVNNETGEQLLPLWLNGNLAKGLTVGEDIVVTGEGPFDTLPARMSFQEESLIIPENCPTDLPMWVVWDRIL